MKNVDIVSLTDFIASNKKASNYLIIKRIKDIIRYLGPAFIVSVAYIDPGNFATNISGGAVFNYSLIWVILWSNIMAIFLQYLSAKLGIATGKNLSEMCGLFQRLLRLLLQWLSF